MSTFEALVNVRKEDVTRALIKILSDSILYANGTAPDGMWSSCPIVIDGIEQEGYIQSFTGDQSEVTDVTLRVFGEEKWNVHISLNGPRETFIVSSTVTIADE